MAEVILLPGWLGQKTALDKKHQRLKNGSGNDGSGSRGHGSPYDTMVISSFFLGESKNSISDQGCLRTGFRKDSRPDGSMDTPSGKDPSTSQLVDSLSRKG